MHLSVNNGDGPDLETISHAVKMMKEIHPSLDYVLCTYILPRSPKSVKQSKMLKLTPTNYHIKHREASRSIVKYLTVFCAEIAPSPRLSRNSSSSTPIACLAISCKGTSRTFPDLPGRRSEQAALGRLRPPYLSYPDNLPKTKLD